MLYVALLRAFGSYPVYNTILWIVVMATRQIAAAYADTKYYSHRVSLHLSIKELQHFHSKSQTKRKKNSFCYENIAQQNRTSHFDR